MSGKLYVVSTPIGNLKDITHRAVEILKDVDLIACEDTRRTKILLNHYGIQKPLFSLFQAKERQKSEQILKKLAEDKDVALVSDAGTPTIQDPGFPLIRSCVEQGIEIVSIPGPSALISALSISGLPTDAFVFEGFLPVKSGARKKKIAGWTAEKRTIIFYESPYRVVRLLEDIKEVLGNTPLVVARELTKKFEEVIRGPADDLLERFKKQTPRGEFVFLLNLRNKP